ncbi:MAG TPA: hypothetical protein VLM36_10190, partial [Sphingomicrobium sp.]|nr:hypothetical protein [Sphingomicrobium sp.]
MKTSLIVGASALALASLSGAAIAQPMDMPGMAMPKPTKKATKKHVRKAPAKPLAGKSRPPRSRQGDVKKSAKRGTQPAKDMPMDHKSTSAPMPMAPPKPGEGAMPMGGPATEAGTMPMHSASPSQAQGAMGGMPMERGGHQMSVTGAFGPYAQQRESSGTAWQPDASSEMTGPMLMTGDWMLMAHGTLNLVYDHQSGPRGDDKAFASGMLMGMARHPLGNGTVQFRAMLSPEPLMGPAGYPLLLAAGETANGRTLLVDRQH